MTIQFKETTQQDFLNHYWQKKPLVIRNAFATFNNPLSPEELAGLSLEEDIESRIVIETPNESPPWHLKRGPFTDKDYKKLPKTHWTLLVQGMDRLIPEIYALLDHFDFIPQWRIDDVMISYAALHGSVGPHFDHYDVFLYQAQGRREWLLTSQNCRVDNYLPDLELRIMRDFPIEQRIILEEGDMLYLPPHIGHHGIALSDNCMTYSFGYRSYPGSELLDSLSDYVMEQKAGTHLYSDPNWNTLQHTSEIPDEAWKQAQQTIQQLIEDPALMREWFACFATRLDQQAEQQLPLPLEPEELPTIEQFQKMLIEQQPTLMRDPCCRFAITQSGTLKLFINGCEWDCTNASPELLKLVANHRFLTHDMLSNHMKNKDNIKLIYDLWTLQWMQFFEEEYADEASL